MSWDLVGMQEQELGKPPTFKSCKLNVKGTKMEKTKE
jgi:hypothetical protein